MLPLLPSFLKHSFCTPQNQYTYSALVEFVDGITRWGEKSLAAGVEHAPEAQRRLLLGGQHLDLSNLDLLFLPDDVTLPAGVKMLDLSGNSLLTHLPDIFFCQSEGMNVNIEGTSVSDETMLRIQHLGKGIHFMTEIAANRKTLFESDKEGERKSLDTSSQSNDALNAILGQGREIRRRVHELNRTREKRTEALSPPFSLKNTPTGILTGLLLVAGNALSLRRYADDISCSESPVSIAPQQIYTKPIEPNETASFSARRLLRVNDDVPLAKAFHHLQNMKKMLSEAQVDAIPPSTVLDLMKVIKPGFLQQMGGVLGGMSRNVPIPTVKGSDYSNAPKIDSMPILDQGVIEDNEILSLVKMAMDYTANTPGYIKEHIIQIWIKKRATTGFQKLFTVIKTMNQELGEEKEWQKTRKEFENIIYHLKNNNDREEYARYEFEYMGTLISNAIKHIQHDSMDLLVYLDQWITEKVKQFETHTGNRTFFTPDTKFALKNGFKKAPQLIHGRLHPDSDGHTLTYKTFSLREIVLGFPFNREAEKQNTEWIGGGNNYRKFMEEQKRNAPFLNFLYGQDLQTDMIEAFKAHVSKPKIQSDIKTISEKMIVLRCITFLSLPEKDRSPELVVAVRGFLDGKVQAKRIAYKGTTLNSVFMIPASNEEGLVLATDDSHFYYVENKEFKSNALPDAATLTLKIIKNEPGLDEWILSKLPQYQRLKEGNQYEPVKTMKINASYGRVFFGNFFTVNLQFKGDYALEDLAESFFDTYTKTYPEDLDTLITSPPEHTREQNKKLAIDIISDVSTALIALAPLHGILNPKLGNLLMKASPLALSTTEVGLVASLINESDHPSDKYNYGNEIVLSLIGLCLDLPDGIRLSRDITKKSINKLIHQFTQKIKRRGLLDSYYVPFPSQETKRGNVISGRTSKIGKNNAKLAIPHDIEDELKWRRQFGLGAHNPEYKNYEDRDVMTIWGDNNDEGPSKNVVVDVYSEDDIYLEMIKLRYEKSSGGTLSSVHSRKDLENSPTSKEVSSWWKQRGQRELNSFGITSSESLGKTLFDHNDIPDEYAVFFYKIKQIENSHRHVPDDVQTQLRHLDNTEGCVHQLLDHHIVDDAVSLPKHEHHVLILYLSEIRYRKKVIKTKHDFEKALNLKRTQNKAINIATSKADFPTINVYDSRYHKELYEKMIAGDFSKALKNIASLSKEGCINAIIDVCKQSRMKLDFIRLHLYSKNRRLTQHDMPRIFIGNKEFALYPLGLKNGLIGIDDLAEFGQGAVLINGNVSLMEVDILKRIVQKKYYSYDITFGSFSDESKLLSVHNGEDKWVPTTTFHHPSIPGLSLSSPLGYDFGDPRFNPPIINKQGVFEMNALKREGPRQRARNNFKEKVKIKFYSQVNYHLQPMSIGVPTTALPSSVAYDFAHKDGRILNQQQAKLWNEAAHVYKDELHSLGVDIVICVDTSMTRNYFNRRYLLSERFKRVLSSSSPNTNKKIKYIHSDIFALPNRITVHNIGANALTKLNASVNKITRLMKKKHRKIAIQSGLQNESSALLQAGIIIKRHLNEQNWDQIFIFKRINTFSGNIHAPMIVEAAVSLVRMADSFAFSDTKHIELLTRYAFKLIFEIKMIK